MDLDKENRSTHSSRIVNHLSERNPNEKVGIGFHNDKAITTDLCYICGKLGHPTTQCPVANKSRNKSVDVATNNCFKTNHKSRNKSWLPNWAKRNLIHPFNHWEGPKLV